MSSGVGKTAGAAAWKIALALATVYVIWGSTYLAMRVAIETLPPFTMAGARYLTAGLLLYGWARFRGAARPQLVHWRSAFIIGGLLLLFGNGGVVWAEQRLASGMAALLISTEPLWIVVFAWLVPGGSRPRWRVMAGLLIGFAGLVLLVRPSGGGNLDPLGVGAVLIASVAWAAGSIYSSRATVPSSPLLMTAMQMLAGGVLLLTASVVTGEPSRLVLSQVSGRSLLAVAYLIVFGALVAFTAYSWLLRVASPVLVSTYAYVNPVVAVFLGWAVMSEPLTRGTLVAAAVILAGVVLITTSPAHPKAAADDRGEPPGETGGPRWAKPPAVAERAEPAEMELLEAMEEEACA
ncbi:MAG TPA: EamA family transporter [Thermoanaerobaculia bacterium]